jgi:hypothetical protein
MSIISVRTAIIRISPAATIVVAIIITIPIAMVVSSPVGATPAPTRAPGVPWIIEERIIISTPAVTVVRSVERTVIAASIVRITIAVSERPAIRISYSKVEITSTTIITIGVVAVVITKIGRRT